MVIAHSPPTPHPHRAELARLPNSTHVALSLALAAAAALLSPSL